MRLADFFGPVPVGLDLGAPWSMLPCFFNPPE